MEKLSNLINQRPDLKSDRSEYLKLAVKEGKVVKGTGPHKVKLVGCENAVNKDYMTQKEVKGVNLLFEENGAPKKYFVPTLGDDGKFHYLIERFADIEEGTELILEYKVPPGRMKGFISVQMAEQGELTIDVGGPEAPEDGEIPTGEPPEDLDNILNEDIPIVEEEENLPG